MSEVPYTNTGPTPVHIGGKRIMPGETRPVHESLLRCRPPAEAIDEESHEGSVLDLLGGTLDEVKVALPDLTGEQLQDLRAAEERGKARKTIIAAIDETLLDRAEQAAGRENA